MIPNYRPVHCVAPHFIDDNMTIAEKIARRVHAKDIDKQGIDYIKHPERVAYLVSEPAKDVAWLHDVLETTTITPANLIRQGIAPKKVDSIEVLTRKLDESYVQYIHRIETSEDPIAIEVKIADLRDNLRPGCPSSLVERYLSALRVLLKKEITV